MDAPILYLSRAINRTKPDYYRLLQTVREEGAWEEWIIYILSAVIETAKTTLQLVSGIRGLMAEHKNCIRNELPKVYSQGLPNNLFRNPYTRIDYVARDLEVERRTASKYLKQLTEKGIGEEQKIGRNNYYINRKLFDLLVSVSAERDQ